MITIKKFSQEYPHDLIAFYKKTFKPKDSQKYLDYIFKKNPFAKNITEQFIVSFDDDKIVGELLSIPAKYYYQEKEDTCIFGCDYIVDREYRNKQIGVNLLKGILNNNYFAIGAKPNGASYKLHVKLGVEHFANLDLYLYPNILHPISIILPLLIKFKLIKPLKKSINFSTPKDVNFKKSRFQLVTDANQLSLERGYLDKWFNNNSLEIDRSPKYLEWRFFQSSNDYYFYEYKVDKKSEKIDGYIVLRPVKYNNWLDVLLVVDYRFNSSDLNSLKDFTKLSRRILYNNSIGFLMFSNSDKRLVSFFNGRMFKIYSYPVMTNLKIVDKNTSAFVSFADADIEINKNQIL